MVNGCAFGKVSRNMIENLNDDFKNFRTEIRGEFTELKATNIKLFNHLSSRVPKEVANKMSWLMGLLGAIIGGVVIGVILSIVE